ncbi:phage antirepressor N-terminal domain-containing protein [Burkholderia sp. S171]|uniref:phage antirepressor N-terminal domain-containing protein n=1 Tax=Burkholderia sp. S171 TaxID=1641860 RepID=UPI001C204248|nr:phage antirepressor N-terminal domain-containing protein [Burkholderia sp. S171]
MGGIGLDWASQYRKVTDNRTRWGVVDLTIPSVGGPQSMTCLPIRKMAAWLTTIEPGKVKNIRVRDRVIQFQNECDDVLWQHWTDSYSVSPRTDDAEALAQISKRSDREPLLIRAVRLVVERGVTFPEVYKIMNMYAGTRHLRNMTVEQVNEAFGFTERVLLGGDTDGDWAEIERNRAALFEDMIQLPLAGLVHPRLLSK